MSDLVLGIETSCDDTSVALVDQNGQIAAIKTVSQYEVHSEFGGVIPNWPAARISKPFCPPLKRS